MAFIDTNIFIYSMEMHPEFGEKAGKVLEQVDKGEVTGYTSSLVLLEMCWYLESKDRVDEMKKAVGIMEESRLRVAEISGADVADAIELRPDYLGVDLNDLVNYSVMRRLGLKDIFTNDSHFNRLPGIVPHFGQD